MVGRVVTIAVSLALLAGAPVGARAGEMSVTAPTTRPAAVTSPRPADDGSSASHSAWFGDAIDQILSDPAIEGRSSANGPAPYPKAH